MQPAGALDEGASPLLKWGWIALSLENAVESIRSAGNLGLSLAEVKNDRQPTRGKLAMNARPIVFAMNFHPTE
ncbi:MAG: hypothetical protein ABI273_09365 [Lacunisphaera sp.]